jgi:hypothetical protein
MRQGELTVFLSHTSELAKYPEHRSFVDAAKSVVLGFQGRPVDMEYFPVRDQSAAALCQEYLEKCKFYVGIIGFRYGSIVDDSPESSYVELEYKTAKLSGLKRLVYLLDPKRPAVGIPPEELYDDDGEKRKRQQDFRRILQNDGSVVGWVQTPEELAEKLTQSLHDALETEQNPGRPSAQRPAADSTPSPLILASAAQQQLRSALSAFQSAIPAVEKVEHSYAEPDGMGGWNDIDEIINKHTELAASATVLSISLNSSFESSSGETENARKAVEKLREEWPGNDAPALTSIIDMISELQGVSGNLVERIAAARDELRRRAAYFPAYWNPSDTLSQAYDLIAEANANTFRMTRALSRSDSVQEAGRTTSVPPMGKGQDHRAPPVHDFGTIGAEVRYVGPPPEYRGDTGIQAAAGEGISPLTEDSSSVPVPSDRVRGSDVMAVRIRGNSMLGAGISNGDDVIVRRQQTAEDGDIVLISIWESGDSVGSANVKRFHQQEGVAQLVSEYEDRQEKEPFQPERHRIVGKVIGTFHPMP